MFRSNIFHFLPYETRGGRGGGILLSNRQLLRTQAGIKRRVKWLGWGSSGLALLTSS
jgi:hypothetical protein